MKHWLIGLLIVSALSGCRQPVEPERFDDPLYRTWRLVQVTYNDGRTVSIAESEWTIVTFRSNGTILYGANGRYAACCSPNRFKRKADMLDFIDVKSIPVPPVDGADKCRLVDCALPGNAWQIVTLDGTELVLRTPLGNSIYEPYP